MTPKNVYWKPIVQSRILSVHLTKSGVIVPFVIKTVASLSGAWDYLSMGNVQVGVSVPKVPSGTLHKSDAFQTNNVKYAMLTWSGTTVIQIVQKHVKIMVPTEATQEVFHMDPMEDMKMRIHTENMVRTIHRVQCSAYLDANVPKDLFEWTWKMDSASVFYQKIVP